MVVLVTIDCSGEGSDDNDASGNLNKVMIIMMVESVRVMMMVIGDDDDGDNYELSNDDVKGTG